MITKKRHFLLLEVLIAFLLVVMCVIPLIYPHTFILISERKFIQKIELDHLVNLLYADIVERLYQNEINWSDIIDKTEFEVDEPLFQKLPYKGTYKFGEIKHKPDEEGVEQPPYAHYLLKLDFKFVPKGEKKPENQNEVPGTLNYHYELFVVRDLTVVNEGQKQ